MSNQADRPRRVGLIGGTGFDEALGEAFDEEPRSVEVETSYGTVSARLFTDPAGGEIALLRRHGTGHAIAPHQINHHANVQALRMLGADAVLSTSAVGSLRPDLAPGSVVLLDDFIDLRGVGPTTFFDAPGAVRHTDFTEPFCRRLRTRLAAHAAALSAGRTSPPPVAGAGTYLCLSGPRYETPAEVRLFRSWGADVAGMTVAPEAILCRELGLCYASVSLVTNLGTGLSDAPLSHAEVEAEMARSRPFLLSLVLATLESVLHGEDFG